VNVAVVWSVVPDGPEVIVTCRPEPATAASGDARTANAMRRVDLVAHRP
jgi:hypothetical protein